ncbi:MAG TPA: hypothetical protein VFJ51_13870 [Nitrososphaeraceae archaeon]|nr:hypothetical protein [Nitrososphaeraceae archaeon]
MVKFTELAQAASTFFKHIVVIGFDIATSIPRLNANKGPTQSPVFVRIN